MELARRPLEELILLEKNPFWRLKFENLSYRVSSEKGYLLKNISGEARDGELLAVMGPSGSGKSTLIDGLAHRIPLENLSGNLTLNGEQLGGGVVRRMSAYVMQDDLLFPMLTVRETLLFAAECRLARSCSWEEKSERVENLIDQLGLRAAAGTIVGDEGNRGVSGGERRRVSIGNGIVHDPILLFLDEPTSGLDSTGAFMVVKTLQRIARNGSVVVMSIHQPAQRIFGLIDRILLLARGEMIYMGRPTHLRPFLGHFGQFLREDENPIEYILDMIQDGGGEIQSLVQIFKSWRERPGHEENPEDERSVTEGIWARRKMALPGQVADFANPPLVEISVLMRRAVTIIRRTPAFFIIRLLTVMATGFILATIFLRLEHNPEGVRQRLSFFAFAISTAFYCCVDALPVFLQERFIFMRETAYNSYRRSSYVIAQTLVWIPSLVILAFTFAVTTFWAVGLDGCLSGFSFFVLVLVASFWCANSFVTFLSAAFTNLLIAYTIAYALLAYFLLLSGFFVTRSSIPPYWIWFHYISLIKYPYEAVLHNEFGRTEACFARGTQVFEGTPLATLSPQLQRSLLANVNITPTACVITGSDVLKSQDVTQINRWVCVFLTFVWGIIFRILFYAFLRFGNVNKRR